MQLLVKSQILAKYLFGTDTTIALIGKQFNKQNFSFIILSKSGLSTKQSSHCNKNNSKKSGYNKATAKYIYCHRSYHIVENCWFLHLEKQEQVGWLVIMLEVLNNLSTFQQLRLC